MVLYFILNSESISVILNLVRCASFNLPGCGITTDKSVFNDRVSFQYADKQILNKAEKVLTQLCCLLPSLNFVTCFHGKDFNRCCNFD